MPHTNDLTLLPNRGWDERILVCCNGGLVQTFIVITQRYIVLVDTVINPVTAQKMIEYARPYLNASRTLLVINTHADYDHAWGNQLFVGADARYPAPIIGSRRCAERLIEGEEAPFLQQMQAAEPDIFSNVRLTPPTVRFDGQLTIDGGDLTLRLFATPGHTEDHISIDIPEITTLLAGDAAELPYPAARTTDGLPLMRASLAKLAFLRAKTVLYCHAPVEAGPQLLHDNIAYFDALEAACRTVLARGVAINLPEDDADVIALTGCRYDDVTPHTDLWRSVPELYRTEHHAAQLRTMLAWVAGHDRDTAQ